MTEIYKTTCNICNKIYIGKHHIDERKFNNYIGSGKKFKEHIKEHGKENFIKQVILYCEDKDVKYYEEKLIELYDAINSEIGLNISKKSKGLHEHTEESKQKQREAMLGKYEGKNNPFYNKKHSKETLQKQRNIKLGKPSPMKDKKWSEESKKKMKNQNQRNINND